MQALASYNSQLHPSVQAALADLEDPLYGMVRARPHFLERGNEVKLYAKFRWADWPADLSARLSQEVEEFLHQHPELGRLDKCCEDWQAVFGGEPDEEAAAEIGKGLLAYFPEPWREHRVMAERDCRGRVVAHSFTDRLGEIRWDLSWLQVSADPAVPKLGGDDIQNLNAAIRDVHRWAQRRVKPILDSLHEKLSTLYGDRFRGLYVFGSYARPDAGIKLPEDSDLDVALLLSDMQNAYDEIKRFGSITSDLSAEYALVVSVIPLREDDYLHDRTNFIRVIKEDAVEV